MQRRAPRVRFRGNRDQHPDAGAVEILEPGQVDDASTHAAERRRELARDVVDVGHVDLPGEAKDTNALVMLHFENREIIHGH